MPGFLSANDEHLIRSELYSRQIKDILEDSLYASRYLRLLADFPDGDLIHIPSIGQMEATPYEEGQAIKYTAMDTGDFTLQITDYFQSGTYISRKFRQDSFYSSELEAMFVPKQARAIMKRFEVDTLAVGPNTQTADDPNAINGVAHRFIGTGGSTSARTISVDDFARALLALKVANVPPVNLVALVDPSVEFTFNTLANITNVINNPRWEGIVSEGMSTGMQFRANVMGFDVYTTQNLRQGLTDTIYGETATNGVANLFFAAAADDVMPFVGAIRQQPIVDSEFNKDLQRNEYVTTMRYGLGLYRPENLVTVITDNTIADPTYS